MKKKINGDKKQQQTENIDNVKQEERTPPQYNAKRETGGGESKVPQIKVKREKEKPPLQNKTKKGRREKQQKKAAEKNNKKKAKVLEDTRRGSHSGTHENYFPNQKKKTKIQQNPTYERKKELNESRNRSHNGAQN